MRDDPRDASDVPLAPADVLWVLGSLCNLHRLPFDAAAFARRTPPPHRVSTLVDALREGGFETRVERTTVAALARAPMPCVALMRDGPALVVSVSRDRVVWFASGTRAPCEASRDAFAAQATGTAILVRRAEAEASDAGDAAPRPF